MTRFLFSRVNMSLPVDKLRKTFLLMLRTTVAGEAIAARDALLRITTGEGYGPYELTDALIAGTHKVNAAKAACELNPNEMAQRGWDLFDAGAWLSEKEQGFVRDMIGWRKPSEKQVAWLKNIYARLSRGS